MKHKAYSPDYKVQENKRKASEIAEKWNEHGTTVYGYLLIAIVYALLYIGDVIKEK